MSFWRDDTLANPRILETNAGEEFDVIELFQTIAEQEDITSDETAESLFKDWVEQGLAVWRTESAETDEPSLVLGGEGGEDDIFDFIGAITMGLHLAHPEYYAPYLYRRNFAKFQQICDNFSIPIPPPPENSRSESEHCIIWN